MTKTPKLTETFHINEASGDGLVTARELIAILQKAPPDAKVVVISRGGSGSGECLRSGKARVVKLSEDDAERDSDDVESPSWLDGGSGELDGATAAVVLDVDN